MDWRKEKDYAYTESLTLAEWAWEFLRRSESYREAFKRSVEGWRDFATKTASEMTEGDRGSVPDEIAGAGLPFGLLSFGPLPDPNALPHQVAGWMIWTCGAILLDGKTFRRKKRDDPWAGYPDGAAFAFNLELPLEPQIQAVTVQLQRMRERRLVEGMPEAKPVRMKRGAWVRYLRLLDGKRSRATVSEMGKKLFSDKLNRRQSAQRALRRAENMASAGYQQLVIRGRGL